MKLADKTILAGSLLTPFAGSISADAVAALNFSGKYGNPCSMELADAAGKEHAVLVINLAADDERAELNAWIAQNQKEKLEAAMHALSEAIGAETIYIVKSENVAYAPEGEKIQIINTARSLVLREESALYHLIETGELRSCPRELEFISEGVKKCPTVMVDGETLLRIYAMAQGTYAETKLVAVSSGNETVLAEVPVKTTLSGLAELLGIKIEKSVLIGGVTGRFVAKDAALEEAVTLLDEWDFVLFAGAKDCLADITRQMTEQAKKESCGKCVLCREGTWHLLNIVQDITNGKAKKEDLAMILDIGPLIQAGAFCSFGQKMARVPVTSVECNRAELEAHFVKKTCPAGVCKAFAKLVIDPSKCTGCTDCADECEEDAISGKKGFIHIIDTDLCENCGKCAAVCDEDAIVMQDGSIRVPKKPVKVGKFK